MPRLLKDLRIDDVSSVDVGAGRGVRVVLTKRDLPTVKREFTQAERDAAEEKGHAMPGGGYPISNVSDLKNAIQAFGRAKNPAATKAHIKRRAAALGRSDLIPENWKKRDTSADDDRVIDFAEMKAAVVVDKAIDFDTAAENIETGEDAAQMMDEVREAICALEQSVCSILCDDEVDDKAAAIAESLSQFKAHVAQFDLSNMEHLDEELDKMTTAFSPQVQKLLDEHIAKAIPDAVAKATADKDAVIAKLNAELVVAKMSERHKAHHATLSAEEQKRFEAMTPDERDEHMDKTKKRHEDDPIYKKMRSENEDLRKRIQQIEDERELDICKRDAKDLGMTAEDAGTILMKARRGDREAIDELTKFTKTLAKASREIEKTSKVFAEFGTSRPMAGDGSAMAELLSKAADLRKIKPDLSEAQAFDKVLTDPANRELADRERTERLAKIHRVA
jgi:hypothetical protein